MLEDLEGSGNGAFEFGTGKVHNPWKCRRKLNEDYSTAKCYTLFLFHCKCMKNCGKRHLKRVHLNLQQHSLAVFAKMLVFKYIGLCSLRYYLFIHTSYWLDVGVIIHSFTFISYSGSLAVSQKQYFSQIKKSHHCDNSVRLIVCRDVDLCIFEQSA